ncbi:MAG: methylated-DNA--[protein]-cysteine S-methyltransferase [Sphaerochaeta sp.]|nr:methylated-DNA--[protein]-cysteine S-methyltransferase [Sphaerochaeta sp.]NCC91176.1 methylated-DNA--[protein]-cysteine S-methyltransferase [Spirochaetia bacterium]
MNTYFSQVYEVVSRIPYGMVASYGHIALLLGDPRQARTVGWALSQCPEELPWHRVVRSDGSIAEREHDALQRVLLEAEGICFLQSGRIDMQQYQWKP